MLGSIKAALASIITTIKSALPTVAIVATTTVVTSACIYYYTVQDGMYEKNASNVRYVLEEIINEITIDSIVENGNGGYAYSISFDEKIDEMLNKYKDATSTIVSYTGNSNAKEIIKKFIKAEIISMYPDLRSETEIRNNASFRENELQGGIKIVRKNSNIETSGADEIQLEYNFSENDQILTYIPYDEFSGKINANDNSVTKYFTLNSTGDVVVAGWEQNTTTVETVEYISTEDGLNYGSANTTTHGPIYEICQVNINYKNSLTQYSMPAGFLWSLLVMGEDVTFVEKLADLAINNTKIIVEAQDNVTKTNDISDIVKQDIKNEEGVVTKVISTTTESIESNTQLNMVYAETWVATYKKFYNNIVDEENNTNIYVFTGTKVQERVNIDEENNFVAYFNNSGQAKSYIVQSTSWLYEMLESHEKTANMLDLFKYLLYQATSGNYGIGTFNFDIIGGYNYNSIGSAVIGNTVEEKVWFTLKANGFSDASVAGVMGNIYGESAFNPLATESGGEGVGLCQWSFGRKEQLIKYAESKGTTWQDVDTQIEFLLGEISKTGGANGYATFQMGVECYGYTYDTWFNAPDAQTATKAFMATFERPNMEVAHTDTRYNAAERYLQEYKGKTMSGGTYMQDGTNGIIGHFTSNITGRTFTIYNQNHSNIGLEGMCHRAIAASLASGYKGSMTDMDVINDAKAAGDYVLSDETSTENFFSKYGLKLIKNQYSYGISNMRAMLTQGKYIAIWFRGTAVGKSGATYSGGENKIHWIAILGYKNENGVEQIFISDPGWGSSGWKNIDEFESCKSTIVNFHTICQK